MRYFERYGHGGDIWSAAAAFGGKANNILDYSANINPLGPPPHVLQALDQALEPMIRYPDPGHRRLKQGLAARLGVYENQLIIGNGAAECMALLLLAERPAIAGIVEPCFSEYEKLSRKFGTEVISLQGNEEDNYRVSAEELEGFIPKTDLCFIGHPNNPTGAVYDRMTLERAAAAAERCGTVLAVDEAFIDFLGEGTEQSVLPLISEYANVVIFRSLTKFYAIPGLRLGYALAHPKRIEAMREKQVSWSVNGLALAAGEAMFCDGSNEELQQYEAHTIRLINEERAWLSERLREVGIRVWPSEANFLLCEIGAPWTAGTFQQALGEQGVLIRSCAMYDGLRMGHFRLAVKDRASNERLLQCIHTVFEQGGRR